MSACATCAQSNSRIISPSSARTPAAATCAPHTDDLAHRAARTPSGGGQDHKLESSADIATMRASSAANLIANLAREMLAPSEGPTSGLDLQVATSRPTLLSLPLPLGTRASQPSGRPCSLGAGKTLPGTPPFYLAQKLANLARAPLPPDTALAFEAPSICYTLLTFARTEKVTIFKLDSGGGLRANHFL